MDWKVIVGQDSEGVDEREGGGVGENVVSTSGECAVVAFASGCMGLLAESVGNGADVGPGLLLEVVL